MPADLHEARAIFLHAVGELPAERWDEYVHEASAGNVELEQRVRHYLKVHQEAGSFLRTPVGDLGHGSDVPRSSVTSTETPGMRVGSYELIEEIGEGGMGTVWMAQQTEPISRLVALKLIKAGMSSKSILARFEGERQALALMDHPHIAKVFDAGATSDGRPYFVMELVKGAPITSYCDEHRLTPRQRLELLIPVCQAVQHAHQKGIIHRDIKPSNVLVANYDNRPVPKVIDFGVAKAVSQPLTQESLQTGLGEVVGTVEYMSPEQATLNQIDVDTRSDIYSLGILLYELLTGSPPFSAQELKKASFLEVLRVIREEEPSKPSTKLSAAEGLPKLAANRGTEAKRLTSLVRGELDWIVMKALEKDRNHRYETAESLAVDLQCYLTDQPVHACPPSKLYRLRKSIVRNKGLVAAVVAIVLALLGGIIGTTLGLVRAKTAWEAEAKLRGIAQENEQRAKEATAAEQLAAAEARARERETQAVLEFVESKVFAAARPEKLAGGLGRQVTLRQAVEAALLYVDKSFNNEPLIEARLRATLGRSFYYLGEHKIAHEQYQKAHSLFEKHRGPRHPDTLRSILDLSNSHEELGQYGAAMKLREQVLPIQVSALGEDHPDTLRTKRSLANSYADFARHSIAVKMGEELLASHEKLFGPQAAETLECMNNLSISYRALGRRADALRLREKTRAIREATLGPDHPQTLTSMHNLAISYRDMGRHEEALKLCEKVWSLRQTKLGPDHPQTLASMGNLATCYRDLGRNGDALELREKVVALTEKKLGNDHPETWRSKNNLAISYQHAGRLDDSLKLREEVYRKRNEMFGADHPDTLNSLENLAASYKSLRRYDDALAIREQLLPQREAQGLDHPDTLRNLRELAALLSQLNRSEEAIPLIDACYERGKDRQVDQNIIPGVLVFRFRHFEKQKNEAQCRKTVEMWEKLNRTDADSLFAMAGMRAFTSGLLLDQDQPERAEAEADQAIRWLRQALATGKKTADQALSEKYFEVLHDREDFQKLMAEAKGAEKK